MKISAKAWSLFFAASFKEMGCTLCVANPDVYTKMEVYKEGYKQWSYMLVYIDDYLCVHHKSDPVMEDLKSQYKLKGDIYGVSKQYLVANVEKY